MSREDVLREALTGLVALVDRQEWMAILNGDWACVECKPYSDMIQSGFKCQYHAAVAALASTACPPQPSGPPRVPHWCPNDGALKRWSALECSRCMGRGTNYTASVPPSAALPVESPRCKKCGSDNVFTNWRRPGARMSDVYEMSMEEGTAYRTFAESECLYRRCRNCSFWWSDPVQSPTPTETSR